MTLLCLNQVSASYGSSQVLFDVRLNLAAGEALAMLGRNGMGKSTSVKSICRMVSAQVKSDLMAGISAVSPAIR